MRPLHFCCYVPKDNSTPTDPLFPIPEGGWEYGACEVFLYAPEDAQAFGSEDVDAYQDGLYFISTGMEGPEGGGVLRNTTDPYTLGGIYILNTTDAQPILTRATMTGLPAGLNLRPHGIFVDKEANRLLIVSHNEQIAEENIVLFNIQDSDDDSLPTLVFEVALYSEQWVPANTNLENWHINDVVVVSPTEFLVTQWGPFDRTSPKHLWSCDIQDSYDNVPQDGRVMTTCGSALDFMSIGLNGIAINDARDTAWVSDLPASQLLEITKHPDLPRNWSTLR